MEQFRLTDRHWSAIWALAGADLVGKRASPADVAHSFAVAAMRYHTFVQALRESGPTEVRMENGEVAFRIGVAADLEVVLLPPHDDTPGGGSPGDVLPFLRKRD
jgi:hypothetical protein